MRLSQKSPRLLKSLFAASLCMLSCSAVYAQVQSAPTFRQQANMIDPNQRWVALPTGIANMTAQKFTLPKDTYTYGIAGMTMFPYYEASPQLQTFLNSRVNGTPITDLPIASNLPPTLLPPTDTIRINIPMIDRRAPQTPSSTKMALRGPLHDEVPWMIAHQGGQSFSVPGDSEALALVSAGTMFNAAGQRTMAIRCGTMWVITGARPVAVLTKYGAVEVKPYSIAAVEQTWLNRVTAADLHGSPVDFQFFYKGSNSKVAIESGKQLSVSESAIASAGTSDYVTPPESARLVAATLPSPVPTLSIETKALGADSADFISDLKTINPPLTDLRMVNAYRNMFNEYGISKAARRDAMRKQMLQKDTVVASKPSTYNASLDSRYFVPVYKHVKSDTPVKFPTVEESLKSLWVQHGVVKYLSNSDVQVSHGGRLEMSSGEAVFVATEPMSVRANDCFIEIRDGAIAQIIVKRDIVVVRNLKEQGNGGVKVKVRSRVTECAAGGEVMVATSMPALYAEMKKDGVTRRNMHTSEIAEGSVMINRGEIELTSLMQYSPIMRQLLDSKDIYDQKLLGQIVKMDAVLTMVTRGRGNYQSISGMPATH